MNPESPWRGEGPKSEHRKRMDQEEVGARNDDTVAQESGGSPSFVAEAAAGPRAPVAPSRAHSPAPYSLPFRR